MKCFEHGKTRCFYGISWFKRWFLINSYPPEAVQVLLSRPMVWSCNVNFYRTNKSSVFSLREEKLKSVIYVDDPYLQGDTCEECCLNIATSVKLLRSLHYTIRMQRNCFLDRQIPVHTKPTNDILGIFLRLF